MLIIKIDHRLHTPMYFFIFNLSFLDICYSSSIMPQTMYNLLSGRHSITYLCCATQMFFIVAFGMTQIFLITIMAYDRYVAISNPLRYKTLMTWTICLILLISVFMTCCMISFIMVFSAFKLPFCEPYEIDHFFCDVGQVIHLSCASIKINVVAEILTFTLALSCYFFNFLIVVISYVYIIFAIMKIRTTQGRLKAFSTCSSHLTVVVVEYACLVFIYLRPKEAFSMDKDKIFVVIFIFCTPVLNPLIYSVRNKAVKSGFKKIISSKETNV
ncbi:olfactory receptor 5A2-like [Discoglossus pictus]